MWHALLTRRDFIKAGVAAWLAPHALLPGRDDETWSFAVFSDTHFGIPENAPKNRALLEEIAGWRPELAIDIGDLTERGWAEEYDAVASGLNGLPYSVRVAPGNHDVRWAPLGLQLFEQRMGPSHQVFEHRGVVFALLDSTVPLSHWGHVGGPQRRWLQQQLARFDAASPVLVFLHHAPGRTPAVLDDDDALGDVLARFNTRVVFTGHGHADLLWQWRGVACTMGKGLYQGSYQHVEVDPQQQVIRIFRRGANGTAPDPFLTIPFRGEKIAAAPARPAQANGALRAVWTQPLGGGVMSHLVHDEGALYVSAMDGTVQAYWCRDGKLRWRAATDGYCHSSPVLAGERVIVGSADGSVYAFATDDGKRKWRFRTDGPVYGSAAVARGIVAIASGDGSIYGLDLGSGSKRWQYPLPAGPSAFSQSPAATDGERAYFGAWDRFVYALDIKTGREVWRYQATPSSIYYSAAIAAPALADGRLYIPSNDNTLHALDARTGQLIWQRKAEGDKFGYSSPRVVGNRIFIGSLGDNGQVHCLDTGEGLTQWVRAVGATIYESSPAVENGALTIGSVDGTLWLLDAGTGSILGSYRFPPGHFLASPTMAGNRVFAATLAESLVCLEITTQD